MPGLHAFSSRDQQGPQVARQRSADGETLPISGTFNPRGSQLWALALYLDRVDLALDLYPVLVLALLNEYDLALIVEGQGV